MGSNVLHVKRLSRAFPPASWHPLSESESHSKASTKGDNQPTKRQTRLRLPSGAALSTIRDDLEGGLSSAEVVNVLLGREWFVDGHRMNFEHVHRSCGLLGHDSSTDSAEDMVSTLERLRENALADVVFAHSVPALDSAVLIFSSAEGAASAETVLAARGGSVECLEDEAAAADIDRGRPRRRQLHTDAVPRTRESSPVGDSAIAGAGDEFMTALVHDLHDQSHHSWVAVTRGANIPLRAVATSPDVSGAMDDVGGNEELNSYGLRQQFEQLELPTVNPVFWMSSPPPSPPEHWHPAGEDINRRATVDLDYRPVIGTNDVILLDASVQTESCSTAEQPAATIGKRLRAAHPAIVVTLAP